MVNYCPLIALSASDRGNLYLLHPETSALLQYLEVTMHDPLPSTVRFQKNTDPWARLG